MVLPTPTFITEENRFNITRGPEIDFQNVTLGDGTFVSAYRVESGDIKIRVMNELGKVLGNEQTLVATNNTEDFTFDLVAIDGNQLALAFTTDTGDISVISAVIEEGVITGPGDVTQTFTPDADASIASPQLSGTSIDDLALHFISATEGPVSLVEHRTPVDGAFSASTSTVIDALSSSAIDAVLLPDGNRVVVVDTDGGGDSTGTAVQFHIIAPDGTFLISGPTEPTSDGTVSQPQVAVLSDGAFAITYRSGTGNTDVLFDIFEADGTLRIGGVDAVVDVENDFHRDPHIVPLDDGGFIVVFTTRNSNAEARRFDADGAPVGQQLVIDNVGSLGAKGVALSQGLVALTFVEGGVLKNRIVITEEIDFTVGIAGISKVGTDADEELIGLSSDDTIDGGAGADTIDGGAGDDSIEGGAGADTIDGGSGFDALSYAASDAAVNVFLAFEQVSGGHAEGDVIANFERVTGSEFNDRLSGDAGDNRLDGGDGDDIIKSKGGEDTLNGGNGDDKLVGSNDNDVMTGGAGSDVVQGFGGDDNITLESGDDFAVGGRGNDVIFAGSGDDKVNGNRGQDLIFGEAGDDDLRGGSGGDLIAGGEGRDFVTGEGGGDIVFGGAGNDVLRGGFIGQADGDADFFVFADDSQDVDGGGGGFDRVKDFEDGIDKLAFFVAGIETFGDIFAQSSDQNGGLKIAFGNGNTFFIENFEKANFDETDIEFDLFGNVDV